MSEAEEFDWGDLGEDFWRAAASRVRKPGLKRPSEEQIRFACSFHRGLSKADSAREAGYVGDDESMRNRGHAAAASTGVVALLEEAALEAPVDDGIITRDGRKRVLSKIVKKGSHSDRIRANDSLERIEQAERAARATDGSSGDPMESAKELLHEIGLLAAPIVFGISLAKGYSVTDVPFFGLMAPFIKRRFPEIWERHRKPILDRVEFFPDDEDARAHLAAFDAAGAAPEMTDAEFKEAIGSVVQRVSGAAPIEEGTECNSLN